MTTLPDASSKENELAVVFAVEESLLLSLQNIPHVTLEVVSDQSEFYDKLDSFEDGKYAFAVCGLELDEPFALEIGQYFMSACPLTPTYFAATDKDRINNKSLMKNGFQEIFVLPFQKNDLIEIVSKRVDAEVVGSLLYRPVRLFDIDPVSIFPFDTYVSLPLNQKYIRFSKNGLPLGHKKYRRLLGLEVNTLYVKADDLDSFYRYSANKFSELNSKITGSVNRQTEQLEKLQSAVRSLFLDIFLSKEKGSAVENAALANCKNIISTYITSGQSKNFYQEIMSATGLAGSQFGHSGSVSVLATLLGLGLCYEDIEDLTVAGLFHDLALEDRHSEQDPLKFIQYQGGRLPPKYKTHPYRAIDLAKERGIILSEGVQNIIKQHHEHDDGRGFPDKLKGSEICFGAQILRFCDLVEYYTCFHMGERAYSLQETLDIITTNGVVELNLMAKIKTLLEEPDASNEKAEVA